MQEYEYDLHYHHDSDEWAKVKSIENYIMEFADYITKPGYILTYTFRGKDFRVVVGDLYCPAIRKVRQPNMLDSNFKVQLPTGYKVDIDLQCIPIEQLEAIRSSADQIITKYRHNDTGA